MKNLTNEKFIREYFEKYHCEQELYFSWDRGNGRIERKVVYKGMDNKGPILRLVLEKGELGKRLDLKKIIQNSNLKIRNKKTNNFYEQIF